jgi:hypothetical protein
LYSDAEGAQLHLEHIKGSYPRCPKCHDDSLEVGRDFRAPKYKDTKAWNDIKNEYNEFKKDKRFIDDSDEFRSRCYFGIYMREKYRYNCGGAHFQSSPVIYDIREKKPWSDEKYQLSKKIDENLRSKYDTSEYHANSQIATNGDGIWYHSNGKVATYNGTVWYHSNGEIATYCSEINPRKFIGLYSKYYGCLD